MNKVTGLLAALALAIFAVFAIPSQALASHAWGNYHWARTANPFTVRLGENLSTDWEPYLATTSSDWSASTVLDTTVVAGTTSPKACKARSGRVEVCNSRYGKTGWLGIAQIWLSGSHITQGIVKVNDTYMQTAPYNTVEEKNHVMCQEVGHTLGLGHQDESGLALGTCMDYSMDAGSQHPNAHDYEQLELIYGHLDSSTTVSGATISEFKGSEEDNGNWGARVHRSENGRSEIYVRHDKNGQRVITFVNLIHR